MAAAVNTLSDSPFQWLADVGSPPSLAGAPGLAKTPGTEPVRRAASAVPFGDLLKVLNGTDAGGEGTTSNAAAPLTVKALPNFPAVSTVKTGLPDLNDSNDKAQSPINQVEKLPDLTTLDWSGLPWLTPNANSVVALIRTGSTTPSDQQPGSPVLEANSGSTCVRTATTSSGMDAGASNCDLTQGWNGRTKGSKSLPETMSLPPAQIQPVRAWLGDTVGLPSADSADPSASGGASHESWLPVHLPASHPAEVARGREAKLPADAKPAGSPLPGDTSKPTNRPFLHEDHDKSLFQPGHSHPASSTAQRMELSGSPHKEGDRPWEQGTDELKSSRPQITSPEKELEHKLRSGWSTKLLQGPQATATTVSQPVAGTQSGPKAGSAPNSGQGSTSDHPAVSDSTRATVSAFGSLTEFDGMHDLVSTAGVAPAVQPGQEPAARHVVAGVAARTQKVPSVKTLADQEFKATTLGTNTATDAWTGTSLVEHGVSAVASLVPVVAPNGKPHTAGGDQSRGTRFMIDQQPDLSWGGLEEGFTLLASSSSWIDQPELVAARTAKAPTATSTGFADVVSVTKGKQWSPFAAVTPHEVVPEATHPGANSPAVPHSPPRVFSAHTPFSVAGQIVSVAGGTETGWVTVSLHPADIGPLKIRVDRDANNLSAEIFAGDPKTLAWLDQNRESLLDALRSEGLALDSLSLGAGPAGGDSGSFDQRAPQGESLLRAADGQPDPGLSRNGASAASWKTGTPGILPGLIDLVA